MGFFTQKKRGISDDEWKDDRSRVRSIFGFSSFGRKKADEVERLIKAHLDADYGSHKQRVMTADELDEALHSLEKDKRISKDEARKIKHTLERDLRD